ncbi:phosphoribosylformylglycinamidine synthase subunit PurQ [Weissella confusa]|uniref:phosphoribosylformylglycinamidine synthase subunit PurQ n=1 Tax=Weissella confusa TaxID=1583 RepID=UPI0035A395F7
MKAAVVRFPGSNCDFDMYYALQDFGVDVAFVDEKATSLAGFDAVFLPGGFSYGDYLRTGAVARFAPVMDAVRTAADDHKLVVGICNGFQILTEAGLLPGQLMMNEHPGFICDEVPLEIVNQNSRFSKAYETQTVMLPVAHGEGRYVADEATLEDLRDNNQIIFKYRTNVNGSMDQIAGISNRNGNVFGMMPHPERAVDALLGNTDGQAFFKSLLTPIMTEALVTE